MLDALQHRVYCKPNFFVNIRRFGPVSIATGIEPRAALLELSGQALQATTRSGAASARLHALGLVHRRRLGIREKVDERLCRDRLL
jgi:hypothetical protein